MSNEKVIVPKTVTKPTRTLYIVVHEYQGNLSMQTVFHEIIENKVCDQLQQWKVEKSTE
ncbi:hypothetical protein [Robinsoniella peoriensis]|uniref:hypothetical protein n=1 Tax=Robinsoniella peoriensis TaxID=180332 RepID=UPI00363D9E0E